MRPARPWSWALLLVVAVLLVGAASAPGITVPGPSTGGEAHPARVDRDHAAGVEGAAVLVERALNPGTDRWGPSPTLVLGLTLATVVGLCWTGTCRGAPGSGARARRPGGSGRRAPPLAAI